jgi:hypothetical protein
MKYVGRASRTEERSTSLPPLDRRVARHPARYLSQLSIIGWNAEGGSLVAERGRPRYVCGKEETCGFPGWRQWLSLDRCGYS